LKALICSLLHLDESQVISVKITNPIYLGEAIDAKSFILDINVLLNNDTMINLELQVQNLHEWEERSLSYLCRSFDTLRRGEDYSQSGKAIHIGFLDFNPFPDSPEFYATYKLLNVKNHRVYSDKFVLSVVCLTEIELATDEDKAYQIDYWARLFKATTWEEIKMIAKKNAAFQEASETLYELNSDETVRAQCRAREDYYRMQRRQQREHERVLAELDDANSKVNYLSSELDTANSKVTDLLKYITDHGLPVPEDDE
jgi:predicted transposase/invertase (TIGR01784 family)